MVMVTWSMCITWIYIYEFGGVEVLSTPINTSTITFGSHNCKLSIDERTNGTFMHFWWMFFSSSLAKMKWAEVETYMIIFGFVLFSGLARWKAFSIEILIGLVGCSNQNWPSSDQNRLLKRFGSKSAKSKVAVRENASGTQSTWVLPSNSPWR